MGRLEEIRARLARSTPGPWREGTLNVWQDELLRCVASTRRGCYQEGEYRAFQRDDSRELMQEDARLIGNAPADLAWLLSEVRRLTEELTETRRRESLLIAFVMAFEAEVPGAQSEATKLLADPLVKEQDFTNLVAEFGIWAADTRHSLDLEDAEQRVVRLREALQHIGDRVRFGDYEPEELSPYRLGWEMARDARDAV